MVHTCCFRNTTEELLFTAYEQQPRDFCYTCGQTGHFVHTYRHCCTVTIYSCIYGIAYYVCDIPNDVVRIQDVLEAQLRIRRVRTTEMPQLDIRDYTTYDVI